MAGKGEEYNEDWKLVAHHKQPLRKKPKVEFKKVWMGFNNAGERLWYVQYNNDDFIKPDKRRVYCNY